MDFEAQCEDNKQLEIQEIIEFPVVPIHVKERKSIEKFFHHYVKPEKLPNLTEFCKNLTGIKQEWVDNGIDLQKTIEKLDLFLKHSGKKAKRKAYFDNIKCLFILRSGKKQKNYKKKEI